jgi:hypothetical protein
MYEMEDADMHDALQTFDSEVPSPETMQLDPDEYIIDPPLDEKDDVAIITPEEPMDDAEDDLPKADDCE